MAFKIAWLESARKELDAEIEYVYSEFGEEAPDVQEQNKGSRRSA